MTTPHLRPCLSTSPPWMIHASNDTHGALPRGTRLHALLSIDDATVLAWLQKQHAWPGLKAIGLVDARRRR